VVRAFLESVTRQIQQSIDIVDLVAESVSLKKRGQNWIGLCPFHSEKTPSFNVSQAKQIFKCFGCNAGGDVFTFVQLREKVGFAESRRLLAARAGISLDHEGHNHGGDEQTGKLALYKANEWARDLFRKWLLDPQLGQKARQYVDKRRLDAGFSESFGVGYAPASWDALCAAGAKLGLSTKTLLAAGLVRPRSTSGGFRDTFYDRLMFPILDVAGHVIAFGGRTLGDDRAKYLNTPETAIFDKGSHLYGLWQAKEAITQKKRAIVVEGYTDCMMAHQHGFCETVATLGTALTPNHIRLLRRYSDNVYLVFDSDEAGTRAAERGLELFLTQQLDVKLVQVAEGKDPCDFLIARGAEAFEATLNGAISALEFKWRAVSRHYTDAESGPARRQAVEEFLSLVATSAVFRSTNAIQRGLVLNQLSKLLAVPSVELYRQLTRYVRGVGDRFKRDASPDREPTAAEAPPVRAGVSDAGQRAMREILEVLINEPGYFEGLGTHFDPSCFEDPDLRTVAQTLVRMAGEFGEFTVSELIAQMEEPRYARLITDLQEAGEARGNFGATIELSVRRLQELENEQLSKEAARRLQSGAAEMSKQDQDPLLTALATRIKQRKGPLPLNMISSSGKGSQGQGSIVQ